MNRKAVNLILVITIILLTAITLGVVLLLQTVFQIYMGIDVPIPALISKVLIFLVLSCFAFYFDRKMSISVD